uniref:Sushi domain-containing protein n=1 Tax=Meleagris gallopavo TaxID=9103 RepID=A0A803Y2M3_MELGA
TSICQADFSWSPPLPACKKGKCSPPNIANGLHSSQSTNKFLPGAVVHYSCKDGFKLVGNVSISCSDVGRWSRPLPRCQGGWRQPCGHCCSVPARCGPALTTISIHRARCQPGGSWDPPVLSCERVQPCPMPPKISNGDHDGHGRAEFTMGMHVTYTCNLGYYLAGNVERVFCKATGKWSQSPCLHTVISLCGQHGMTHLFPHGTVVYYSCKDGFELVGNVSISCLDVGRWSRPLPRCQAIGCQSPTVHNGKVQALKNTYEAGETLRFDCDAGYAAEGSHRARCQPGGSWDPPVLRSARGFGVFICLFLLLLLIISAHLPFQQPSA